MQRKKFNKHCNKVTKTERKEYKIVFDKRVICENYTIAPYGM
jgi:hypothetical protein